jgi:hypothetical protein
MVLCTLTLFLSAGLGQANAAMVLLLSTDNADEDAAIQTTLQALGHQVDVGAPYYVFDGTGVLNYDVVLLVPNYNYSSGDMPAAGQMALKDFVNSGHGLVTTEWTMWLQAAYLRLGILAEAIPVVATTAYRSPASITYTSVTADDILNAGLDPFFTFMADSIAGGETGFVAKDGATMFYGSDYSDGAGGVIGWSFGAGRVISFSTVCGQMELGDGNYSQLLRNAITWSTNPQ